MIYVKKFYFFTARAGMRFLHILLFLLGVQLMINGAFFSSPLLTALGASSVSLFLLIGARRHHHQNHEIGPTYHQLTNPHTKETYFAPLALIALIGGALAYLFLPIVDVYHKTAVTLAGTGLVYLLLATFAHGWTMTRKNILGMLFSGLLILGIGGIIALWWGSISSSAHRARSQIQSISFTRPDSIQENNEQASGATLTGGELVKEASMTTGEIENISNVSVFPSDSPSTKQQPTTTTEGEPQTTNTILTYGHLIPYLVYKYQLSAAGKPNVNFTYIPQSDARYEAFKAAYYAKFFSRSVNPDKQVSCENYAVFVGLADQWSLSYTAENVYSVFRNEAEKRGALNGCKPGAYVKRGNMD